MNASQFCTRYAGWMILVLLAITLTPVSIAQDAGNNDSSAENQSSAFNGQWPNYVNRPTLYLNSDQKDVVIKGRVIKGGLLIKMSVGEYLEGDFLVAVDSRFTVLDTRIARSANIPPELGLPKEDREGLFRRGAVVATNLSSEEDLMDIRAQLIPTLSLSRIASQLNAPIIGIIGLDVLKQQPFTLDLENGTLTFHKRETFAVPQGATPVQDMTFDQDRVVVPVDLGNGILAQVFLSNTFTGGVGLFKSFSDKHAAKLMLNRPTYRRVNPFARPVNYETRVMGEDLGVFGYKVARTKLFFLPIDDPILDEAARLDGNIGQDVLRHYSLTFDLENNKMWAMPVKMKSVRDLVQAGVNINQPDPVTGETPLARAVRNGDLEMTRSLIRLGVDVNRKGRLGLTPIHIAAGSPDLEMLKLLVESGADINAHDSDKNNALLAAVGGTVEAVEYLIGKGADVNSVNAKRITPLTLAAQFGNLEMVKLLIDNKADVNQGGASNETALLYAAFNTDGPMVQYLLNKGADPNLVSRNNHSALLAAVERDNIEVARMLVDAGADVNVRAFGGLSPIYFACGNVNVEMFQLLVNKGASLQEMSGTSDNLLGIVLRKANTTEKIKNANIIANTLLNGGVSATHANLEGQTPLMHASFNGNNEMVKRLLDSGADPNRATNLGVVPLMLAAEFGHVDVIETLVKNRANVNAKQKDGATALHFAAKGRLQATKKLLELGAEPDVRDEESRVFSPLVIASQIGDAGVVNALLDGGAFMSVRGPNEIPVIHMIARNIDDPSVIKTALDVLKMELLTDPKADQGRMNQTPLMMAASSGDPARIEMILNATSKKNGQEVKMYDVNARTNRGQTALMYACSSLRADGLIALINAGAEINTYDHSGLSPLMYAVLKGNMASVKLLVEKGADVNLVSKRVLVEARPADGDTPAREAITERGTTALTMAIKNRRPMLVKYLLENGADPNIKIETQNALLTALQINDKVIFDIIDQHMNK